MERIEHMTDYYWRKLHIRDYNNYWREKKNAHLTDNYWRQLHIQEYKNYWRGKTHLTGNYW